MAQARDMCALKRTSVGERLSLAAIYLLYSKQQTWLIMRVTENMITFKIIFVCSPLLKIKTSIVILEYNNNKLLYKLYSSSNLFILL